MKRVYAVLAALSVATGLTIASTDDAEARRARTAAVVGGVLGGLAIGAALSSPAYAYDPYYYDYYPTRVYDQPRVYGYYYQPPVYRYRAYYGRSYPRYTRSIWHDRPAEHPCWWCW